MKRINSDKSESDLFNIDIIAPTKNDVSRLGKITKLNIFEFSGSQEFEPEGLFSTEIFGHIGSTERNITMGYVDLKLPILHPLVYQYLLTLNGSYKDIINGKSKAIFDEEVGDFVLDADGSYGLYYFIKHFDKIKTLDDNGSDQRKKAIELVTKYTNKEHMTKYILVLPSGMRDYTVKDGKPSEDEINNLYRLLLSLSGTLNNMNIDQNSKDIELYNSIVIKIHNTFLDIYLYIKDILDGKGGFIQNKFAKKGISNSTRNVLTPSVNLVTNLNAKNKVNITDTVVGLHQYMVSISQYFKHAVIERVNKIFDSESDKAYLYNKKTMELELVELKSKDVRDWTTFEGLEKQIKKFKLDDMKYLHIELSGYYFGLVRDTGDSIEFIFNEKVEDFKNVRPITYIEFYYMAIYDIRNKYPGIVTRFPVDGISSTYITSIFVRTTIKDRTVKFKDGYIEKKVFNYPILSDKPFNSMSPHYSRLSGMGADHDGDMTSLFILFSDESIKESFELLNNVKYYISPDGNLVNDIAIGPAEYVIMHMTDTFKGDTMFISFKEYIYGESKDKAYEHINKLYTKHYGTPIKNENIDNMLGDDNLIYFAIDNTGKVLDMVIFKYIHKLTTKKESFFKYTKSEYFLLFNTITNTTKENGKNITEHILRKIYPNHDAIILTDTENELYKELGFNKIDIDKDKKLVMVYKG